MGKKTLALLDKIKIISYYGNIMNVNFYLIFLCSIVSFCYSPYIPHPDDYVAPTGILGRMANIGGAVLGHDTDREIELENKLVDRRQELVEKDIKLIEKGQELIEKDLELALVQEELEATVEYISGMMERDRKDAEKVEKILSINPFAMVLRNRKNRQTFNS